MAQLRRSDGSGSGACRRVASAAGRKAVDAHSRSSGTGNVSCSAPRTRSAGLKAARSEVNGRSSAGNGSQASSVDCGGLRLHFASNRLTLAKLLELLAGLPCERVEALEVSQNDLGDSAPTELLRCLPGLKALSLSGCGVGADGIRAFAIELATQGAKVSEDCDFSEPAGVVGGTGVAAHGSRSGARGNGGGSSSSAAFGAADGVQNTAPRQGLQALDLSGCSVDGACADLGAALAGRCCQLTALDLSFSALGREAVRHLASGLRLNSTLRSLRFEHCSLRDSMCLLLEALGDEACRAPLKHLNVARNALPDSVFRAFGSFLCGGASKRGAGPNLIDLDVSGNVAGGEEGCSRALGSGLLAPATNVAAVFAADLASAPAPLCNGVSAAPWTAELRLNMSGMRHFFDAALGRWDVAPHVLTALRNPACRVAEVVLDQCTFSEAAMPTVARVCLNVRSFSMCGQPLGEVFAHFLADVAKSSDQRREAQCKGGSSSSRGFVGGPGLRLCLRELRLNDAALQDVGASLLADALISLRGARRDGRDLQVLEVSGNHFTAEAMKSLSTALVHNAHLRRLALSRNRLRQLGGERLGDLLSRRVTAVATAAIVNGTAATSRGKCSSADRLEPLDLELRHCALTTDGVLQVWAGVLAGRVERVDLAENSVDDTCVQAMHSALRTAVLADALVSDAASPLMGDRCNLGPEAAPSPDLETVTITLHSPPPSPRAESNSSMPVGGIMASHHSLVVLSHLNLQPNPCSCSELISLIEDVLPWQRIDLQTLSVDAPIIAQLLNCLGHGRQPQRSRRTRGRPAAWAEDDDLPEYALSLSQASIVSQHWQWNVVADAVRYTLSVSRELPPQRRPKPFGSPWRRHGGCAGHLLLQIDNTDLSRVNFTVPRSIPQHPAMPSWNSASLARNARKEIRGRTLECSKRAAPKPQSGKSSLASRARGVAAPMLAVPAAHTYAIEPDSAFNGRERGCLVARGGTQGPSALDPPEAASPVTSAAPSMFSFNSSSFQLSSGFLGPHQAVDTASRRRPVSAPSSGRIPSGGSSTSGDTARLRRHTHVNGASGPEANGMGSNSFCWNVPMTVGGCDKQQACQHEEEHADSCYGRSLERCGQPDVDMAVVLRQLRGLESLRLTKCKLTDRQLAQLCHSGGSSKWSAVRVLDLASNCLTSASGAALAAVVAGGLELLNLDSNRLQAQGFRTLASAIKPGGRCALKWLSVADNDIGPGGGAIVASLLAQAGGCPLFGLVLARNPRLSSIEVSEILRTLCRHGNAASCRLEFLDLSGSGADNAICCLLQRALASCPALVLHLKDTPLAQQCGASSGGGPLLPADVIQLVRNARLEF